MQPTRRILPGSPHTDRPMGTDQESISRCSPRNARGGTLPVRPSGAASRRVELPEYTHEVWMPTAGHPPGAALRLTVYTPYRPRQGHRFNPNKLLLDPYALETARRHQLARFVVGYPSGTTAPIFLRPVTYPPRNSAFVMPKWRRGGPPVTWGSEKFSGPPHRPWSETIITKPT